MNDNKLILAHLALFGGALIYAANFTIAKPVMAGDAPYVQPFGFIMMRVLAATAMLWLTHLLFIREKVERQDFPRLALCAVFGIAGNQLSFFYGLKLTTPINGALIMLTTPILVLILSIAVFGERLTWLKGGGIAFGLAGALLLILSNQANIPDAPNPTLGNVLIGVNAAFYAIYLVLAQPLMMKYSPFTTLKWVFLFGTIYVLPFGWGQMMEIQWEGMPSHIVWSIVYVLVFVTYLTYVFNGLAARMVTPSVASAYIYLQPLLASIIAVSVGKDQLTVLMMVAAVLIFVGVYMVSVKRKTENG